MPALYTFAHKLLIFIAKSSVDTYTLCLHQCLHYTVITTQKSGHTPRDFLSRAAGKAIGAKENPPARDRFYCLPPPVCRTPRLMVLASQPNITPHCHAHLLVRFCDCSADNSADKVHMCLHYFTIEYQRVASKSVECRQKHKYWQTRVRARESHVHTMQRRMHKSAFNVIKTRVMKENA